MKKGKGLELILLFIYFLFISFLAYTFKMNLILFSILGSGIPSIILLAKNKSSNPGVILKTFLIMTPAVIIFDTIATYSETWYMTTIFSFRLFGLVPIENFLWGLLYILLIIAIYEYFFDKGKKVTKENPNYRKFLIVLWSVVAIVSVTFFTFPSLLNIPYFYALFIVLFVVFCFFTMRKKPELYLKTTLVSLYLLIPSFAHEFVSLELGHWYFEKGNHLGYIEFGKYMFPFEELIWFFVVPVALICVYEIFLDDGK